MNRNVGKFVAGGLGIVAVAVAVLYLVDYIRYRTSPEYRINRFFENLNNEYAKDTYGGDTPEETLQLFIEALKKGDTDLASKYFVLDKQEKWKGDLAKIKDKGLLGDMVKDLEKVRRTHDVSDNMARFELVNEDKEVITVFHISRSSNGIWKILDL